MRSFASDNNSGVHPRIMQALVDANQDHAIAYGDDPWTRRASSLLQQTFGTQGSVLFVFNGTGANVTSLASLMPNYGAVLCTQVAHIHVDECAAPENIANCKLLSVPTQDGKLTVQDIESCSWMIGDYHHPQPTLVSITQATELGSVYTAKELRALAECCKQHGLLLHMDGARLCNAAAALGCSLRAISSDCGVDVLSLGGTKNGMMFGEAVLFLNPELGAASLFHRKQAAQLPSKTRFVAAQFEALLEAELWRSNAQHANRMAARLATELQGIGVELTRPTESNAVFARLPQAVRDALFQEFFLYLWDASRDEVRLMASFDTSEADLDALLSTLAPLLARAPRASP